MVPLVGREVVSFAVCLNFTSFVLLLIATISPTWSWGNAFVSNNLLTSGNVGPWVAGQVWSNVISVPCGCNNQGICFASCPVSTTGAAMWREIPVESACEPLSQVFVEWSGPLEYCNFPEGFVIPEFPPLPPNGQGYGTVQGNIPPGTSFSVPSKIIAVEALIITGTVCAFFAMLFGFIDSTNERNERVKAITSLAMTFSFLTWAVAIPAYVVWTSIQYVQELHNGPALVSIPVWASGNLVATNVDSFHYGASWGLSLAASVLSFFAWVLHVLELIGNVQNEFIDNPERTARAGGARGATGGTPPTKTGTGQPQHPIATASLQPGGPEVVVQTQPPVPPPVTGSNV